MIKEVEYDRFKGRQGKCSKCCYRNEVSCGSHECYSNERSDGKNVYFVEIKEE